MKRQLLVLIVLVAAMLVGSLPTAQACNGYGLDGGYGWLYHSLRYNVPHFAAFPPVYYSYPVPRTYGYSPFAYPPSVMTPEVVGEVQPLEIINPHVPTKPTPATETSDRTAATNAEPQPLVIINPFVGTSRSVARN